LPLAAVDSATLAFNSDMASLSGCRFAGGRFDAVVSVEAAHLYPDVPAFLREVHRVLRPGGCFLYADVLNDRFNDGSLLKTLEGSPLRLVVARDITANIVHLSMSGPNP